MAVADLAQQNIAEIKQAALSEQAASLQEQRGGLTSALALAQAKREQALGELGIASSDTAATYGAAISDVNVATKENVGALQTKANELGLARFGVTGVREAGIREAAVKSIGELSRERANKLASIALQKATTGAEFGQQISEIETNLATLPTEARLSSEQLMSLSDIERQYYQLGLQETQITAQIEQAKQEMQLAREQFDYSKAKAAQDRIDALEQQKIENALNARQVAAQELSARKQGVTQTTDFDQAARQSALSLMTDAGAGAYTNDQYDPKKAYDYLSRVYSGKISEQSIQTYTGYTPPSASPQQSSPPSSVQKLDINFTPNKPYFAATMNSWLKSIQ